MPVLPPEIKSRVQEWLIGPYDAVTKAEIETRKLATTGDPRRRAGSENQFSSFDLISCSVPGEFEAKASGDERRNYSLRTGFVPLRQGLHALTSAAPY